MRQPPFMHQQSRGFVLVTVLWTLTILVLGAAAFSYWIEDLRLGAEERRARLEQTVREQDLLAQVLYTRLVSPRNFQGVAWPGQGDEVISYFDQEGLEFEAVRRIAPGKAGFMPMAGEVYDVGDGLRMMVQDHAGLMGLHEIGSNTLYRYMARGESDPENMAEILRDMLLDYVDTDVFSHPKGGEGQLYKLRGLGPPADGALRTPMQLREVVGWAGVLEGVDDTYLISNFRAGSAIGVNVNTATPEVLKVYSGTREAESILQKRAGDPIDSIFKVPTTREIDQLPYTIFPGYGVRIWIWRDGNTSASVYDTKLNFYRPGERAWALNWFMRAPLPDDLAKKSARQVEHVFFR